MEQSPFWTGFWDGIKEKAWGIILTTTILVVLAIPTGGGTLLAEAKAFLTSTIIPQMMAASTAVNLIEIVEAYWAYDRLGKVMEALDGFSKKASNNGYVNTSSFFKSISDRVKEGRTLIAENTALDLLADLTVMDLFLVFGKGDATEYERGRAWGRVVGTALSFLVYAYTYYRFFTDGPKLLSWQGKIKAFLRGAYNWVTPPLWDFGVALGKLTVDKVAASLYLSEQNQRFKEYLNLISEDEASLSRVVEFTDGYLENALKISEGLGLSEKAFLGLLWAYGNTAKDLGEEDWNKFLKGIQDIGGDSRRFVDELLRWLYNAEDPLKIEQAVLEVTPRLADLSAGELESMGKALAKVGDSFENGLKLFDAYFAAEDHYGKRVAKVFLENVAKHPERLDAWLDAFARRLKIVFLEPDSRDSLIIEGKGVDPGVYRVAVIDPETGEDAAEGVRGTVEEDEQGVVEEKRTLRFREAGFDTGRDYLAVFTPYGVKDFFQDVEAPPRFVRLGDGDRVLLVTSSGEAVAELDANVKAASGSVYLEFKYDDVDGDTQRFRLSISGELYLGQAARGETVFKQRVVGIGFKVFDDWFSRVLAKLLEITYGEKASPMHLVVERSIPDADTFFLRDRDGFRKVEAGQTKITLGEDFEKVLGKDVLEKLQSMLRGKKAALALVYVGEDNAIHSVWSQELEFSFKHHPVKENGIIGLYVVRVDGVDGFDLGGETVRLTSVAGGYELTSRR